MGDYMKITEMKINGVREPMGYLMDHVTAAWKVEDTASKKAVETLLEVAADPEFRQILLCKKDADSKGTLLCAADADQAAASGGQDDALPDAQMLRLTPRTAYYWRVTVTGDQGDRASGISRFETGKMDEPWQADWIAAREEDTLHPVFSKHLTVAGKVSRARLYVSGVGLFEAYLNGQKIGDEYLTPYVTNYECGIQYITFPVEGQLREGDNELEIYCGKGWYMGLFGLELESDNYGNRMAAIAELHIEYEDQGRAEEVISTDDTWQYRGSDIEDSGIYDGEILNRRLWETSENTWKPVTVLEHPEKDPGTKNLVKSHLRARLSLPVREQETLEVQEIIHTPAGENVLDFGQNFAGWPLFQADFPAGTRVRLEFGEILQGGNFYHGNYRDAKSEFVYISDGRKETVRPHFTFYGFRYIKVTGWPGELSKDSFQARALYSDLDRTGWIESGHDKFNRLYLNTLWGQRSNFIDIPTDCPQRSERLGWTGDAQVFTPTATYHMDTEAFFNKFMRDLRDEQQMLGGAIANYVPNIGHKTDAGSVWGDVGTFMPWNLYRYYGDKENLKAAYPMMKDWVDWIDRQDEERGRQYLYNFGFTFGDWLALDGPTPSSFKGSTDDDYVATAYYYRSAQIVSQAAEILGNEDDARHYGDLADHILEAIRKEFFTPSGRLAIDTQTALIVALKFDLGTDRARLVDQFCKRLHKDMYSIKGGFVGAPLMCTVMGENHLDELTWDFLLNESFPGWLYEVNMGATTIWERWNSVMPDGTMSPQGMNSLNHYSYGSCMEYVYAYGLGIRPAEPGFTRAVLEPHPDIRIRFLKGAYDSVSGRYECGWEILDDGQVRITAAVPFGASAELILPRDPEKRRLTLDAGRHEFIYRPAEDYRKPYSEKSRIARLAKDPQVMGIFGRLVPPLAGMAASGDPEMGANTLEDISHMGYLPIDPAALQQAIREVSEVTVSGN